MPLASTYPPRWGLPVSPRPDQVVTIAALSSQLPDRFISDRVAHALRGESGLDVLLVRFEPSGTETSTDALGSPLRVNGEFDLVRHLETTEGGVAVLHVKGAAASAESGQIESLLRQCTKQFSFVLLWVEQDIPEPLLFGCIAHSDRTFLLLRPRSEDVYERDLLLRDLSSRHEGVRPTVRTVLCSDKSDEHFGVFLRENGDAADGIIHNCPPRGTSENLQHWPDRDFNADIRRLAREISRRRVGLALSSGGARGLSHVGVIQVLEENGIEVDVIAGCSMGSYVGAVWAYGYDGVAMERLAREVEHRWGLFELIDPFILPRQGFLRGEKIKRRLQRSIGDVHFSELVRPLRIVATHLASLGRVVFSTGEVAQAVHASSAIPGACVPVSLNGELYIDGGISDPLPVDVLREMGIERVIASNTIPTADFLRSRLEIERERDARHGRRRSRFKHWINTYLNYFAPGNILDTILRSFNGAQMRVAEFSALAADVVVSPLSFDGRWHDFRRPGKYIAIGRRATEEKLDEIRALVQRKEPKYEAPTPHHALAPLG